MTKRRPNPNIPTDLPLPGDTLPAPDAARPAKPDWRALLANLEPVYDATTEEVSEALREQGFVEHEDPFQVVRDCFTAGGALLSVWQPQDAEEREEMRRLVELARNLAGEKPIITIGVDRDEMHSLAELLWSPDLAEYVITCLGILEASGYRDKIFANTLTTYDFDMRTATPNDYSRDDRLKTDPNEPKILVQGTRAEPVEVPDHEQQLAAIRAQVNAALNEDLTEGVYDQAALAPDETVIAEADRIISGPRAAFYGDATVNHQRIADFWNTYIMHVAEARDGNPELLPHDVAIMMILLKLARIVESPSHRDSYVDTIGYAALAHRMAQ